ncbi:MAG: hypothetical protein CMK92_02525 [Pseudomonas sp.]|nr:hypothetical protein [Pseudomonas sp.]
MATPGQFHTLTVSDVQSQGLYLDDGDGGRILLPNRYVPEGTEVGNELSVFIYLDSDDRLIATTQRPRVQLHQAAFLLCKDVNRTGAFMDWGLPKDLFVPFGEQKQRMEAGQSYVVYVTEDNTGRLIGSARLNRFIRDEATSAWPGAPEPFTMGDKVKLLVAQRTDIGYKAIVNDAFWGVLHTSQIHKAIRVGQRMEGYVRRLREDNRLDLSLEPIGHTRSDPLAARILKKLEESQGQLGLNDYSPAELIEMHFGVSKRAFKMAVGKLYKAGKIVIEETGIRLRSDDDPLPPSNKSTSKSTSKSGKATPNKANAKSGKTNARSGKAGQKPENKKRHTDKRSERPSTSEKTSAATGAASGPWSQRQTTESTGGKSHRNDGKPARQSERRDSNQTKRADKAKPSNKTVYRNPKTKTSNTLKLKK